MIIGLRWQQRRQKWTDSKSILEVELIRLANRPNVGSEGKRKAKDDS